VNYYGQEWISGASVAVTEREEYSDAGRSLYPDGMFLVLQAFHRRYPNTRFMITENGVADEVDLIRPSYMVEHLLALHAAIKSGVDVAGTHVGFAFSFLSFPEIAYPRTATSS